MDVQELRSIASSGTLSTAAAFVPVIISPTTYSSSAGDHRLQTSSKSVQFLCEAKEIPMAQDRYQDGHGVNTRP